MMTDLDDWHSGEISRRKLNVLMAMGCRKNWRHIEDRAEYAEDNTQELNHKACVSTEKGVSMIGPAMVCLVALGGAEGFAVGEHCG